MNIESQFDREEETIYDAEERGEITREEATRELRELQRDYAAAGRDSAQEAYKREIERW